jgi:Cu/Ag efflux protein CusF
MNGAIILAALVIASGVPMGFAGATSQGSAQSVSHNGHRALTDGEVRKIDKQAKKITLRHGAIRNLDMPGMTMVFSVTDPTVLDKVKPGDKVRFAADKVGDALTVTHLELVK